jgi:hypothetical protein
LKAGPGGRRGGTTIAFAGPMGMSCARRGDRVRPESDAEKPSGVSAVDGDESTTAATRRTQRLACAEGRSGSPSRKSRTDVMHVHLGQRPP